MRRWLAAGLAGGALSGCLAATPLPLSPVQLLLGGWPPKPSAEVPSRAFTILADTFSYPELGFSLRRPNSDDWEFRPTANGVAVLLREGPDVRVEGPNLQVVLLPVPAGFELAEAVPGELAQQQKAGVGVVYGVMTLDGLPAVTFTQTQALPAAEGRPARVERSLRVYVAHAGLLVLVEARAREDAFIDALPAFESMLETLRVPQDPPPAEAGARVPLGRTAGAVVPALGLSLKTLDAGAWLATTAGKAVTLERRALPTGGRLRPALAITVGELAAGADLAGFLAQQKAALEQAGASLTVATGTLAGVPAESWRWTEAAGTTRLAKRRLTARDGNRLLLAEQACEQAVAGTLEPEFEALLAGLEVAKAPAQPPASATAR